MMKKDNNNKFKCNPPIKSNFNETKKLIITIFINIEYFYFMNLLSCDTK